MSLGRRDVMLHLCAGRVILRVPESRLTTTWGSHGRLAGASFQIAHPPAGGKFEDTRPGPLATWCGNALRGRDGELDITGQGGGLQIASLAGRRAWSCTMSGYLLYSERPGQRQPLRVLTGLLMWARRSRFGNTGLGLRATHAASTQCHAGRPQR